MSSVDLSTRVITLNLYLPHSQCIQPYSPPLLTFLLLPHSQCIQGFVQPYSPPLLTFLLPPHSQCIQGFVQLYSGLNECLQRISAHAVIFTNYRFAGNPHESTVLCLSGRDFKSNIGKVSYTSRRCKFRIVYQHQRFHL